MQGFHDTFSRPGRRRRAAAGTAAVLLAMLGPVLASGQARAAADSDRLLPGETLRGGQSITAGQDVLTMQGNGNLVLIAPGHTPVWASHTAGHSGASLVMQPGGNLVITAPGGQPLWSAGTGQHPGSLLVLQPNGNAVISAPASAATSSAATSSVALWSTDTGVRTTSRASTAPRARPGPTGKRTRATDQPGARSGRC